MQEKCRKTFTRLPAAKTASTAKFVFHDFDIFWFSVVSFHVFFFHLMCHVLLPTCCFLSSLDVSLPCSVLCLSLLCFSAPQCFSPSFLSSCSSSSFPTPVCPPVFGCYSKWHVCCVKLDHSSLSAPRSGETLRLWKKEKREQMWQRDSDRLEKWDGFERRINVLLIFAFSGFVDTEEKHTKAIGWWLHSTT